MIVYYAVALPECFAQLDGDVRQRQVGAVIEDATAGTIGVLRCRVGAGTTRSIVGSLAAFNHEILKDDSSIRVRDMKHAVADASHVQPARVNDGRVWS